MSLILEALKKLERDKQAGDRGFLVMAAAPWPSARRGTPVVITVAVTVLLILVGAGAWFLRGRVSGPAASSAPVAGAPSPVPSVAPSVAAAPAAAATLAPSLPTAPALATPEPPRLTSRGADLAPPRVAAPAPADDTAAATEAPTPAKPKTPLPPYRLSAISEQEGRPVAVLNDRVVSEGDVFDGIKVLRIGESEVEIEVAGERRTVRF